MPKKIFFENELNDAWREAREKGIEYGIAEGFRLHERNKASVYGTGGSNAESYGGRWGI